MRDDTRNAFTNGIDEPLKRGRMAARGVPQGARSADRLAAINKIFHRTDRGPGGYYDNPIPHEATASGHLELEWNCGEGERSCEVAEVRMIKHPQMRDAAGR